MKSFRDIKRHYDFAEEDERRLSSLRSVMVDYTDCTMDSLESWMLKTRERASLFADENKKKRVFAEHRGWFLDLFSGTYDVRYYERLIRIGNCGERDGVRSLMVQFTEPDPRVDLVDERVLLPWFHKIMRAFISPFQHPCRRRASLTPGISPGPDGPKAR